MTVKIHLIRTNYPHWGEFSGINQFAKYIDTDDYKIETYLVSDSDDDFPIKNRAICKLLRGYVQKQGMHYYKLSDLMAEVRTFRKSFRAPIDIIHYLDGEHSCQYLPSLYRLINNRPKLVAMYHQPPNLLAKITRKDIIRRLDAVLVVSPDQIPYFQDIIDPDKIHLIMHGIDTNFFRPCDDVKVTNKFKCITVGHWLRDFKVIRVVAEKLSVYRDIEFHVIASLKSGPLELGLENLPNVFIYRDTIDDFCLRRMYQQSDVLFLPLLESTANNALLEGLSTGLPIVSTLLPSVKAYISNENAFLIEGNDPNQFITAILHLYNNPSERKKMEIRSRKRAEELDWHRIVSLYEDFYSKITQ